MEADKKTGNREEVIFSAEGRYGRASLRHNSRRQALADVGRPSCELTSHHFPPASLTHDSLPLTSLSPPATTTTTTKTR